MKKNNRFKLSATLMAMSMAFVGTAACSSNEKKQQPAPPSPADQAMNRLATEKKSYVDHAQQRVNDLTEFASQLHEQSTKASIPKAKKMQSAAADLNISLLDVREELVDVKQAKPEDWIDQKRDVDRALNRAESQYTNSVSLLR